MLPSPRETTPSPAGHEMTKRRHTKQCRRSLPRLHSMPKAPGTALALFLPCSPSRMHARTQDSQAKRIERKLVLCFYCNATFSAHLSGDTAGGSCEVGARHTYCLYVCVLAAGQQTYHSQRSVRTPRKWSSQNCCVFISDVPQPSKYFIRIYRP